MKSQLKLQGIGVAGLLVGVALLAGCKHKEEAANKISADTTLSIHVLTTVVEPRSFEDW